MTASGSGVGVAVAVLVAVGVAVGVWVAAIVSGATVAPSARRRVGVGVWEGGGLVTVGVVELHPVDNDNRYVK